MKKLIAVILTLALLLTAASCGSSSSSGESDANTQQGSDASEAGSDTTESAANETGTPVKLKETASTDIVDFTLTDAKLTYYASSNPSDFVSPIEKSDGGYFAAATGRVLVILTMKIKNKDRGYMEINGNGWELDFKMHYNGEDYPIRGFSLNNKDGDPFEISLMNGGVSEDGGKTWTVQGTNNEILDPGQTLTFRVAAIAVVNPASLKDPFSVTVNVPTSSGTDELFTYSVG